MLEQLFELSQEFLQSQNQSYQRYFIKEEPHTHRLTLLLGQRGVGKTTLMIQYLLQHVQNNPLSREILYIPSDHFALGQQHLYDIAKDFVLMGGKFIAFDEIHKYEQWSIELKSIYDTFSDLKIMASGSSALKIHKGSHDLSRRSLVYNIAGLSFREYVELNLHLTLPVFTLDTLLEKHQSLANNIIDLLAKAEKKVLPLFKDYLTFGYYPYFHELNDPIKFKMTLEQNIHATLESDIAAVYPKLTRYSISRIKLLLTFIAKNVPFTPNWHKLKSLLEMGDERTLKNYFYYLEDAQLITCVYKASNKLKHIQAPSKVYLQNPNLIHAIGENQQNKGTLRELFFYNMLSKDHVLTLPSSGDFLVDKKRVFDIGGKNKNNQQIYQEDRAYLACDDIEIGINQKIPLWLFGFVY